jgi:hypothetical protein
LLFSASITSWLTLTKAIDVPKATEAKKKVGTVGVKNTITELDMFGRRSANNTGWGNEQSEIEA